MKEKNYCALYVKNIDNKLWKIIANLKDVRLFSKNIRISNGETEFVNEILTYYKAKEVEEVYPVQRGACLIDMVGLKVITIYSDYLGSFEWNCSLENIEKAWQEVVNNGWCKSYEDLMLRMSSSGVFDVQEEYQMLEALNGGQVLLDDQKGKYPNGQKEIKEFIDFLKEKVGSNAPKNSRVKLYKKPDNWQYKSLNLKEQWLGMESLFLDNPMPWESNQTIKWSEDVLQNYMLKMSGIIDVGMTKKRMDFLTHLKANIEAQREAKVLTALLEQDAPTATKHNGGASGKNQIDLNRNGSDSDQSVEKGKGRSGRL